FTTRLEVYRDGAQFNLPGLVEGETKDLIVGAGGDGVVGHHTTLRRVEGVIERGIVRTTLQDRGDVTRMRPVDRSKVDLDGAALIRPLRLIVGNIVHVGFSRNVSDRHLQIF